MATRPVSPRLAAASIAVLVTVAACRGPQIQNAGPIAETEEGRFPHQQHADEACTSCHALAEVLSGQLARPGAADHAPCDREKCHRAEFLRPPGKLCRLCHLKLDPSQPDSSIAAPYPPERGPRSLASSFSHAEHLDYGSMEKHVGFHVSCSDCHIFDAEGTLRRPAHAVCDRCHAPGAAPPGTPSMRDCEDCHRPRGKKPSRLRRLIVGDLQFHHAIHRRDRTGKPIRCTACHTETATATEPGAQPPPATRTCVTCHDDVKRTPSNRRMRICETCHASLASGFSRIAPRSHLPAPDRPEDHTLAFRRDHSADAEMDSSRCSRCHTFMSGSDRDTCDECHQVMRPQDHVITWTEFEHGPASATRADRCATCHPGEFCTACHSKRPRSHFPSEEFRLGGHGALAAYDMRACVTCHVVERDRWDGGCTGSGCHTVRLRR